MGFFDDIKSKIFGPDQDEVKAQQEAEVARRAAEEIGQAAATKVAASLASKPIDSSTVGMARPTSSVAPSSSVDVAEVLDAAVAKSGQDLQWKTSIIDLLKALGLDSSITARKTLADELGYTGDKSDSATMNVWLHKHVLTKLAANGGKVPETLIV